MKFSIIGEMYYRIKHGENPGRMLTGYSLKQRKNIKSPSPSSQELPMSSITGGICF